jgi:hypothetical protein
MANVILFAQIETYRCADRTEVADNHIGGKAITPRILAERAAGLGRVKFSRVLNGHEEIKDQDLVASFLEAFRAVIAEPGSDAYQEFWEQVQDLFDEPPTPHVYWTIIPLAYHGWANIALDPAERPATRLLFGRMAEYVLYQLVHVMKLKGYLDRKDCPHLPVSVEDAAERGQRVVDDLAEILSAHPLPPNGLFEAGKEEARRRGYRVMRTRLLSDQVGWRGGRLNDQDGERARILTAAFSTGMADDLMWLHKLTGGVEIADPYHAFVLALHSGDWRRASEYGCTLLSAHPAILTSSVKNLTALCDDRAVRPGIAAMLADEIIDMPAEVRTLLHQAATNHPITKSAVEKMIPGVRAKKTYLEVLALGETK